MMGTYEEVIVDALKRKRERDRMKFDIYISPTVRPQCAVS